jgi:hypothetical protein
MPLNTTLSVKLARLVILEFENSPLFEIHQKLAIKEPAHVRLAREVLREAQGRLRLAVAPKGESQ